MHVRSRQDQLRHLHSSEGTVAHAQVRWIIHFSAPEADSLITVQKNNCSVCRYLKHIASSSECMSEIEERVCTELLRIGHVFQIEKRACFLNSGI